MLVSTMVELLNDVFVTFNKPDGYIENVKIKYGCDRSRSRLSLNREEPPELMI